MNLAVWKLHDFKKWQSQFSSIYEANRQCYVTEKARPTDAAINREAAVREVLITFYSLSF